MKEIMDKPESTLEKIAKVNAKNYRNEIGGDIQIQLAGEFDFYQGFITGASWHKEYVESESWKPSEEQMDRLFSIVAALRKDYCDDMADFLANLYTDLKKLGVKEEPEYYQHFDPDC